MNLLFRLIDDFLEAYKFIIVAQFLWHLTSICASLLIIQEEMVGHNLHIEMQIYSEQI